MRETMSLRPATSQDGAKLAAMITAIMSDYGLKTAHEELHDLEDIERHYAGGHFEILEDNGTIAGCYGIYPLSAQVCELRRLYLSQNFRGRGLGRRLLEEALQRALSLGFERMELSTSPRLVEAIGLYRSHGFEPIEGQAGCSCCSLRFSRRLQ